MYWDCAFGLLITLAVGHGVMEQIHHWLHKRIEPPPLPGKGVPPWFTGLVERAIFFLFVAAYDVPGITVSMMVWLGIKMAANWNRPGLTSSDDSDAEARRARGAIAAAVLGLMSMGFALVGGLICRGAITG